MLSFAVAVVWGAFAGQFFLQGVYSFLTSLYILVVTPFSPVEKKQNLAFSGVLFLQAIVFAVLCAAGNILTSGIIDYDNWRNPVSIACLIVFGLSVIIMAMQIPGKFLVNRVISWDPGSSEVVLRLPKERRPSFTRDYLDSLAKMDTYKP